jgi:uncharacterized protein
MLAAAAALGLLIGAVIGGLGGGGGVLTVPALVYLLGQSAQDATTGSVIIVGVAALVGALARIRGHHIDWRTAIAFGLVGIPATYLGTLLNRTVGQPVLLLAFAALTLTAAAAMLLNERRESGTPEGEPPGSPPASTTTRTRVRTSPLLRTAAKVIAYAAVVGFLTGFLGVGGGFLVVPALVIGLRTPMPVAVGTSLLIILLNSVSSVAARMGDLHLDWQVVVPFTLAAVAGTLVGKRVADKLSGATLARAFAVLLIGVGLFVATESALAL